MAPQCSCPAPKCMKPGRVTRNAYLNFLRMFRKKNCGLSAVEIVKQGAKKWNSMSRKDKSAFIEEAKKAPMTPRRSRLRSSRMGGRRMRGSRARGSASRRRSRR